MKTLVVLLAGLFSTMSPSAASAEEVAGIQLSELLMRFSDYTPVVITWSVVLVGLAFVVAHRRALDRADRIRGDVSGSDPATNAIACAHPAMGGTGDATPKPSASSQPWPQRAVSSGPGH